MPLPGAPPMPDMDPPPGSDEMPLAGEPPMIDFDPPTDEDRMPLPGEPPMPTDTECDGEPDPDAVQGEDTHHDEPELRRMPGRPAIPQMHPDEE